MYVIQSHSTPSGSFPRERPAPQGRIQSVTDEQIRDRFYTAGLSAPEYNDEDHERVIR